MNNTLTPAHAPSGVARARMLLAGKVASVTSIVALGLSGGMAGAVTYDPTADATSAASSAGSLAGPVIVAVFTGVVGLYVLRWAIKYIQRVLSK